MSFFYLQLATMPVCCNGIQYVVSCSTGHEFKSKIKLTYTSRETDCTPGSQPPSVPVLKPGVRIQDWRAPPLVSVSRPGLKVRLVIPTGTKEAARSSHVGRPFSPGWYFQPGLKIFFFFSFFNWWIILVFEYAFYAVNNIRILHVYNVRTFCIN